MNHPSKSSIVIAQMLASEGCTDHTFNLIRRYWKRRIMNPRVARRLATTKKLFGEMVKEKLNDRDKIILGRMMGLHWRMALDTGLRIGLMGLVTELEKGQKNEQ